MIDDEILDTDEARKLYSKNMKDFHQNWIERKIGNWFEWCDKVRSVAPTRVKDIEKKLEKAFKTETQYLQGERTFMDMCNAWEDWSVSSLDLYDFCK